MDRKERAKSRGRSSEISGDGGPRKKSRPYLKKIKDKLGGFNLMKKTEGKRTSQGGSGEAWGFGPVPDPSLGRGAKRGQLDAWKSRCWAQPNLPKHSRDSGGRKGKLIREGGGGNVLGERNGT